MSPLRADILQENKQQDGIYPQWATPAIKLKYTVLGDANGPMLHFERNAGGITYEITSTQECIWICDAEYVTFETQGETHPANKKSILGHIAKNIEKHLGETNCPYLPSDLLASRKI